MTQTERSDLAGHWNSAMISDSEEWTRPRGRWERRCPDLNSKSFLAWAPRFGDRWLERSGNTSQRTWPFEQQREDLGRKVFASRGC